MTKDDFIVAIELGSSKVTAIAGRKRPDGEVLVIAQAQEPADTFIRKGRINNYTKMTSSVENIKRKLEKALDRTIKGAYVGIGGMGMHTVSNTVGRRLGEKQIISEEMVDAVKDANIGMPPADKEILEVIPQDYKLDTQTTAEPIGMASESIEGHFLNIVASASLSKSVSECFRGANLSVVGMPISTLCLADSILTEPEKRSGCVFVDMGAETTSVAVYKNNILRHFAVIPLGGANINRDICTLQIEDAEAEQLKRRYARAYTTPEETPEQTTITFSDGRSVSYEEFQGLVEARMEEIILNIKNQIDLSGYDDSKLVGGIIVTGGASSIRSIDKAFTGFTTFKKIRFVKNTRIPVHVDSKSMGGGSMAANFNADGSFNTVIAMVERGEISCDGGPTGSDPDIFGGEPVKPISLGGEGTETAGPKTPEKAPEPTKEKPQEEKKKKGGGFKSFFKKLADKASTLVSEDEDKFPGDEK